MNEHLYRSRDDRMLAGVAGGLAELWDADPSLIRIVWALLVVLTGGIALVVYVIMAIVVPEGEASPVASTLWEARAASGPTDAASGGTATPPTATPLSASDARAARRQARAARRAARREGGRSPVGLLFGVLLIVVGGTFLVREWLPALDTDFIWPLALVALGVVVLIVGLGRDAGRGGTAA